MARLYARARPGASFRRRFPPPSSRPAQTNSHALVDACAEDKTMNMTTGIQMVVVALIIAPAMPIAIAAQDHPSSDDGRRHYESNPGSNVINNRGAATRVADTSTPDLYDPNCASGSCPVNHGF